MTPQDESRDSSEGTRPMLLLINTEAINTGAENVRKMWETGKTNQIATEVRIYDLAVLGTVKV